MKTPKLLSGGRPSCILRGNEIIASHQAVKVTSTDSITKLTINRKVKNETPIDIILLGVKKPTEYQMVFGKDSHWKVNLFVIYGKNTESILINMMFKENADIVLNQMISGIIEQETNLNRHVTIQSNAKVQLTTAILTSGKIKMLDQTKLMGVYADYLGDMLVIGRQKDEVIVNQSVEHLAKNTTSLIHNSLVSNDEARLKFEIFGTIQKYQAKSSCFQHSKGIILGEKAWIEVDPKLIINEYDVEAGHGAAVGQINQDELYYLSSRGLDEALAKRLIIQGYTDPFVTKFEDINHQLFVNQAIKQQMGGH